VPSYVYSQQPVHAFKKFTIEINNVAYDFSIISIVQDNLGYLWMTTGDGLLKYNGYEFELYRNIPGDSTSLIHNTTESLLVDFYGDLWVGTGRGLSRYKHSCDCFIQYHSRPGNPAPLGFITSMSEDTSHNLWIGMQEGGLFRYDRDSDRFTRFLDDSEDPNSLTGEIIRVVLADSKNNIWIGTGYGAIENGGGLIRFDPVSGISSRFMHEPDNPNSLMDNRVSALMEDRDGNIWVGTYQNGLHRYDPGRKEFARMVNDPSHSSRLYPSPGQKAWELPPFISVL
jgi:ligand-binding sensor domain-containing protein